MVDSAQLSPFSGFVTGLSQGIPIGSAARQARDERQDKEATEALAEGFASLLNDDFRQFEQPAAQAGAGFQTGAIPSPADAMKRVGYGGTGYFDKQKAVRALAAKTGDPDAVLAAEDKMAQITQTRTMAALDRAIAASQFGNKQALMDAATEMSVYMFPGITPTIQMAETGDAMVISNRNPDGTDAGNLVVAIDPESLMNLKHQMQDLSGFRTMNMQAQQFDERMRLQRAQFSEQIRQYNEQRNSLSAAEQRYYGLQDEVNRINNERLGIERMGATADIISATTGKNGLARRQAELENEKLELERRMAPLKYGQEMANGLDAAFEKGEGYLTSILGVGGGGTDPESFDFNQFEQYKAAVGSIAALNFDTPFMRATPIEYLQDYVEFTKVLALAQQTGQSLPIEAYENGQAVFVLPSSGRGLIVPVHPEDVEQAEEAPATPDVPANPALNIE